MDWPSYKELSDRPDIWSCWMLNQCAELFRQQGADELSQKLYAALDHPPLQVPEDYRAGPDMRMYQLALPLADRQLGHDLVIRAVADDLTTAATAKRGLGGFSEAWAEFVKVG